MSVLLHLLDAEGKLAPYRGRLEDIFATSVAQLRQFLPVSNVDVVVYVDPVYVIPELGLGGFSPGTNRVLIAVDPDNAHFVSSLEQEFLFSGPRTASLLAVRNGRLRQYVRRSFGH